MHIKLDGNNDVTTDLSIGMKFIRKDKMSSKYKMKYFINNNILI